jgi:hypothetical protein
VLTTLNPYEILPISGSLPYTFRPGLRKLTQECSLQEWWKMDEVGLATVDRVGAKLLIPMACAESGGGTIVNGDGILPTAIPIGVELTTLGASSIQQLQTLPLTGLAFPGVAISSGITITGWFRIVPPDPTPNLNTLLFSLDLTGAISGDSQLQLEISGNSATARLTRPPGATVISLTQPFPPPWPIPGQWYFFRIFYDSVLELVGMQFNDDVIFLSGAAGIVPPETFGQMTANFTCSAGAKTVNYDEIAIWAANISDSTASFIYNSGIGRTYPFV